MIAELEHLTFLLDANNRAALIAEMQKMKREKGEKWLKEFKTEFPDFVLIIDLIANHDADAALPKFKDYVKDIINDSGLNEFLKPVFRSQADIMFHQNTAVLRQIHADFRAEIDKPRF